MSSSNESRTHSQETFLSYGIWLILSSPMIWGCHCQDTLQLLVSVRTGELLLVHPPPESSTLSLHLYDRKSESFRTSEIILPEGTSLQSAKLLGLRSKSYNFVLSFHPNNRYNCWLYKQVYCKYIIVQAVEVKFNKEEARGKRIMCNFKSKFLRYLWVFLISSRKKNMQVQIRYFVMSALSRVV